MFYVVAVDVVVVVAVDVIVVVAVVVVVVAVVVVRCIAGYVDNNPKNPLTVVSTSEGTLDEFVAVFASDSVTNQILYGYVRVVRHRLVCGWVGCAMLVLIFCCCCCCFVVCCFGMLLFFMVLFYFVHSKVLTTF